MGKKMNACTVLTGKSKGKRLLGRSRHERMDVEKQMGWYRLDSAR
jgi:hypothetical protein